MKRAAWLILPVFALGIATLLFLRPASPPSSVSPAPATGARAPLPSAATPKTVSPAMRAVDVVAPPPAPEVSRPFVTFLETDSKLLDSMHIDERAAENRLNEQALHMGPSEVSYARTVALTAKAPANERILAVALLTSPNANLNLVLPALRDLITQGMNSGRAEPHTVDEISNVQTKSFAIMAIDSLAERAAKDNSVREDLIRMGEEAKDNTIRNYIAGKLRALPQ